MKSLPLGFIILLKGNISNWWSLMPCWHEKQFIMLQVSVWYIFSLWAYLFQSSSNQKSFNKRVEIKIYGLIYLGTCGFVLCVWCLKRNLITWLISKSHNFVYLLGLVGKFFENWGLWSLIPSCLPAKLESEVLMAGLI